MCDFRAENHPSDITVGDFWKVERYYKDIPTKQGLSAVQINTSAGEKLFQTLVNSGKLITRKVSRESIWEHRSRKNFNKPSEYDLFWKIWNTKGLDGILNSFPANTITGLIISKIRIVLTRVFACLHKV